MKERMGDGQKNGGEEKQRLKVGEKSTVQYSALDWPQLPPLYPFTVYSLLCSFIKPYL